MNINQEILKNITTNNKGTKASWDKMREATSIKKMVQKAKLAILHMRTL